MSASAAASVRALVLAPPGSSTSAQVLQAVRAQTRPVDELVTLVAAAHTTRAAAFDRGLREARDAPVSWLWLLDGRAIPAADALERLLEPIVFPEGPLPSPILVASKVVDPTGRLDADHLPWPRLTNKDVTVDACERRLVSVRAVRHGSVLIARRALEAYGLPHPGYEDDGEDLEWPARLLKDQSGFLAPRSVAVAPARCETMLEARARRHRDMRNRASMLRGTAWAGEEKLWFGFLLGQDAVRHVARERDLRAAGEVTKALSAGLALRRG